MEYDAVKHIECIYNVLTSDILDHLKVGVAVLDSDLKVKWANHFLMHELCGQINHVVGVEISQILSSISNSSECFRHFDVTDQLCNGERVVLHTPLKNGVGHRWLEHRLSPISSDIYNEGWIGYFYDITDQMKSKDSLSLFGDHGYISFDNALCERSERYLLSPSESIKKYTDLLLDGEVNEERIHAIEEIQANAEKLNGLVRSATMYMGKTEFKFKTLFENTSDPMVIFDLDGKIWEINQVACDVLGYSYFELLGMDHSMIYDGGSLTETINILKDSEKKPSILLESFCNTRDGVCIPVELNCRLIDYEEKPVVLITSRDMSERKHIEHLSRTNKELKCLHDTKDVFVDILRHDLMNPAGVVKGYSELLSKQVEGSMMEKYVRMIRKNNNKIIDLIESASKYAKLESIEDIVFERLDLIPILKNVIEDFEPHSSKKSIDVSIAVSGEWHVYANPMVDTVFANYLSNAIKYSPEGSKVEFDVDDLGDMCKVLVKDNGIGVLDEDKPFVFERFTRLNSVHIKGAGLGLAIVKRIAELHNGQVGVDDNPDGKGCAFWVILKKSR
ncbi:ATP-binding protein [Methanococcoides burtonii]|uniref:histidine kinase n=1 Tax=Methanococcoides burtonii (strain DSM 6242 / NBRC 107633 / OCM 468 / ACE-M) TaxID=259564 RepID=Q12WJ1_METBU|nr:ATP-binding protein [Methanococcoides burtonii]ABE52185.1 Sensor protein yyG-like multisensor signal transduction histidine kinase [Methanococcoides burtonii DSM 6242]